MSEDGSGLYLFRSLVITALIFLSVVHFEPTACYCAPERNHVTSNALKSSSHDQIDAARNAANRKQAPFTETQRLRYRTALEKNLKRMKLAPSAYEKMLAKLQGIIPAIINWFKNLFKSAPRVGKLGDVAITIIGIVLKATAYLLVIAAATALLYALYLLIKNAYRTRGASHKIALVATTAPDAPEVDKYEKLFAEADRFSKEGNFYEALRRLHLASILVLTRSQIVVYSKDKTNREYLRNLVKSGNRSAIDAFWSMTDIFDGMMYGGTIITGSDYETARKHAVSLGESL